MPSKDAVAFISRCTIIPGWTDTRRIWALASRQVVAFVHFPSAPCISNANFVTSLLFFLSFRVHVCVRVCVGKSIHSSPVHGSVSRRFYRKYDSTLRRHFRPNVRFNFALRPSSAALKLQRVFSFTLNSKLAEKLCQLRRMLSRNSSFESPWSLNSFHCPLLAA